MKMEFSDIAPHMKAMVESYSKPWGLTGSEYTFTNLLIWGGNGRIRLCESQGALFILLTQPEPFMFAPLAKEVGADYSALLDAGSEYLVSLGAEPLFKGISGPLVGAFGRCPGYELVPDRDNFDYIYAAGDLLHLAGKKFHSKRNHIHQFKASYQFEYVRLTPAMLPECLQIYCRWLKGQDTSVPGVLDEMEAIRHAMNNMELLGIVGGGIRVDGRLVAFTLGERINEEMAVVHIEKADELTGLYTMINQQFVENEFSDMRFINREEDMGIEGLRKAKLSYRPVTLLEKFEGRPRK